MPERLERARREVHEALEASRRASERLANTLESITDAFFTVDRDWCFTYVNGEAERVLQRRREELLGCNVWAEFPEAVESPVYPAYHRAMDSGVAEHLEFHFPPLDIWFEVHAYPSDEGLAVYFRDITPRKRDEETMQRMHRELEYSNAELRQFAFAASHDLREPLRKVRVFADRLVTRWDDLGAAARKDHLCRMNEAAARMDRMLDALLGYSRVSMRAPVRENLALADIVADALQDLELRVQHSGAQVHVAPDLPRVHCDREQMRQVLSNLLGNAMKFAHPERALRVDVRAEQGASDRVSVEVEDNGRGFDPAHAQRLFEPFERLERRASDEGSGMGLAIVRSIIARHGGQVTATARPGVGARFRFDLPAAQP